MFQTLFHVPYFHIPVYGYGVMLVIGFIAAMYLAQYLAARSGFNPELFANAAVLGLVTGVIGARLSHVLENFGEYTNPNLTVWQNFFNAINIREGGLTYYGGFLLAFPSLVLYGMWKKVPIRRGMDIIAPCLMVSLGFGRIGCFLNGCCYGAECNVPWAVTFPYGSDAFVTEFNEKLLRTPVPRKFIRDNTSVAQWMDSSGRKELNESDPALTDSLFQSLSVPTSLKSKDEVEKEGLRNDARVLLANPVHPAEIYSAVTAFLIAAFLLACLTLPHLPGRIFAGMMMIEGVFRYLLEMLRVEPAVVGRGTDHLRSLPPQSYSMVVSVLLVFGGLVLWFVFGRIAAGRNEVQTGKTLQPA